MIVKVKYFDIEKYEGDWKKYFSTNNVRCIAKHMIRNLNLSPTDRGFSPYLKDVDIKSDKLVIHNNLIKQPAAFDYIVEIDNDYLYHDQIVGYYISHIHTLRVLNEYYTKYKNLSHLVDLSDGVFGQIERELKLKTIIDD